MKLPSYCANKAGNKTPGVSYLELCPIHEIFYGMYANVPKSKA